MSLRKQFLASNYVRSIDFCFDEHDTYLRSRNGNRYGWAILKGGLTDLPKTLVKKMSKSFSHNLSDLRVDDNLLMP